MSEYGLYAKHSEFYDEQMHDKLEDVHDHYFDEDKFES